jgi:putative hydrolase of the HAD superfamily
VGILRQAQNERRVKGEVMRKPLGIIFDMGDTIVQAESVDTLAGNRRLLELAESNPGVTAEYVQKVADEIYSWIDRARDESMIEFSCEDYQRLLFDSLGITFRIGYSEMEREFWNHTVKYRVTEGIGDLLDLIEARGMKTGILSNTIFSSSILKEELARHNLAHRFSFVVSSADYGVRKPHPHIFRIAVKKMGLKPEDIWFVGDQPEHDIKGALDSGIYPVWYNRRNETTTIEGNYLEVKSFDELREKIEQM